MSDTTAKTAVDRDEQSLVAALRNREEAAFCEVVRRHQRLMLQLALAHVEDRHTAEDVVQETWLAVIKGIDSFEGRSSLRTWIFRILAYQAAGRRKRDGRGIPFSALASADAAAAQPSVDPGQFLPRDHPETPFAWASDPAEWPEEALLASETRAVIYQAIEALPATQRVVIALRDLDGWPPREICEALDISDGNQRVLLHRARSSVREAVDRYLRGGG
jgi:RNA polymerase sigma-70 factor (ECF subfamily)